MDNNYLKKHIEAFFTESTAINANLNVIEIFIVAAREQYKKTFPTFESDLYGMMTAYRDLSQLEGGDNLYDTGNRYELNTDNLDEETIRLLSYISCLTITQIFEVFESYLKNILSESICRNPELIEILKIEGCNSDFFTIRNSLFQIQGANNKGFIKALRKISPFFKFHERNNIWERNMSEWFNLISIIRHLVIHQRQKTDSAFFETLAKIGLTKTFNKHFSIKNDLLILTPSEANVIVSHLYEYAHLIYKGISSDFDLILDIDFKPFVFGA